MSTDQRTDSMIKNNQAFRNHMIHTDQPVLVHYDTSDLRGVVDRVLRDRDHNVRQVIVRVDDQYLVRFVPVQGSWKSLGGQSTLTV